MVSSPSHPCSARIAWSLFLSLVTVVSATAQTETSPPRTPRGTLVGRVVDPERAPIAGATVHVVWAPRGSVELAPPEHVIVTASDRGYFTAKVAKGLPLVAWFIGPIDEKGEAWISEPVDCSVAVSRFQMQASRRGRTQPVKVLGLEPWRDLGPFSIRLRELNGAGPASEFSLAEDEAFTMPVFADQASRATILCADGQALFAKSLTCTGPRPPISVPEPRTLPVSAVDEKGQPAADVEIWHRSVWARPTWGTAGTLLPADLWRRLGATDAEGRAVLELPSKQPPLQARGGQLLLRASKKGNADSHSGRMWDGLFVDGKKLTAEETQNAKELRFVMHPAAEIAGSLPRAIAGPHDTVLYRWTSKIVNERGGWSHLDRSAVAFLAEDGSFSLPFLPIDAYDLRFSIGNARFVDSKGVTRWLPAGLSPAKERPSEPHDVAAGGLRLVNVKARDQEGQPAAGAVICALWCDTEQVSIDEAEPRVALDLRGSGALLLPGGKWWLVLTDVSGYAFAKVPATAGRAVDVELVQQPWNVMSGILRDRDEKPVAGAQISSHRSGWSFLGDMRAKDYLEWALHDFTSRNYLPCRTDAEGRFRIRFLSMKNSDVWLRAELDGRTTREFLIEENDEPLEVTLR